MEIIPHGYQVRSVQHCLDNPRSALFLDMGLGKTVIVLTTVSNLLQRQAITGALVLAPLRVVYNVWPNEVQKWDHLNHLKCNIIHGKRKAQQLWDSADIYVSNYESLFWIFEQLKNTTPYAWPFDMIVFDESTALKNQDTKRFKLLKLMIKRFQRRIILTGTPSPNSMLDLWAQYFLLDDGKRLGTSKYWFKNEYFFQADYHGYKWDPLPGAKEDITKKISDITMRLKANDYLHMPKLINNEMHWEMSDKHYAVYKELENDFIASIDGVLVTATNAAALSSKLRQYVSGFVYDSESNKAIDVHSEKIDALAEIVEGNPGENILCAIQFRYEYELIKQKFPNAPVIYGSMSQAKTRNTIRKWNESRIPLLIVHPASIAHGVNLQEGGRMLVWFGIPWSLEHYLQLVARLHRQGQEKPVVNHFLVAKKTVETRIVAALQNKEEQEASFLQGIIDYFKTEKGKNDVRKAA